MEVFMKGTILEMNSTDASILLDNGTTIDIHTSRIPSGSKVGSKISLENFSEDSLNQQNFMNDRLSNEKLVDFF